MPTLSPVFSSGINDYVYFIWAYMLEAGVPRREKEALFHLALAWGQKCNIRAHNSTQFLVYQGMMVLISRRKADLNC